MDRHRLQRRLRDLQRKARQGSCGSEAVAKLEHDVERAVAKYQQRAANVPTPDYPEELPVSGRRDEITTAIRENQVVIVAGETGSGKTTQLPKIALEAGRGVAGLIGHTQPRRIAARSVASRIAEELKSELGNTVGYKVRFSDRTRPESYIKLMTDGILLAEIQRDRYLNQYDTLIIDEAHERSLNIDFLLGFFKQLLPKRPDLKLIITSATIDTERFASHFSDAPIIEVSGRTYPVELRYRPLQSEDDDSRDRDQLQAILDAVDELSREGEGDILIFLPGERDIRETAEALRKHHPPHTEILPLYARLSASEQNRVFQSHRGRRIVLATNVAETSLTVPGIRYVIDPGYVRLSRYSYRSKVQRLPIEKVSQASANQRSGRCGRLGPGIAIRLYAEEDFNNFAEFTDPEVKRTNLAAVILQMQALGLGDIEDFPFVEPPDSRFINDGYKLLHELGAVDNRRRMSKLGQKIAKLPVDPRIGRMLLAAEQEGALAEVLVIAAALSIQDPRERPHGARDKADQRHNEFNDEQSDFLTYLKLWQFYEEQRHHLTQSKLRKLCRDRYLSYMRMREWREVWQQLHTLVKVMGAKENSTPAEYDAIHRALLSGLLGNIGFRDEKQSYLGARNSRFHVFPGSAQFKKPPKWLMAGALIETSKLYAHTIAAIKPEWIERLADHLVKRSYSEPHWEKRAGQVAASERVTLYGVTINPKRRVNFGPIKPDEAREIFIRSALVEGEFNCRAPFFKHNRKLLEEIESLEHRSRRRDVLVDEQVLVEFYEQKIPTGIYSGATFEKWRRGVEAKDEKLLFLTREELMQHDAAGVTQAQFPPSAKVGALKLKYEYHFEPGSRDDGVTLQLPLAALNQIEALQFEWLVPGLLREKLIALIKSLPKSLRRNFVPAPNFADALMQVISFGEGSLFEQLSRQLLRITGVAVDESAWQSEQLTDHLRMNYRIVDAKGKVVGEGRDLELLQADLGGRAKESFSGLTEKTIEREGITEWDFGDLPEVYNVTQHGLKLQGYPALVDQGESVAIELFDDAWQAEQAMHGGLRRLIALQVGKEIKYLQKNLPGIEKSCLHYTRIGNCNALKLDLVMAAIDHAFLDQPLPRTEAAFHAVCERGRGRLIETANRLSQVVAETLAEHHAISKQIKGSIPPTLLEAITDVSAQLGHLVYPGFVLKTPAEWLSHLPRYLKAVSRRLDKVAGQLARDRQHRLEIESLWRVWAERSGEGKRQSRELLEFRWLIEELRVSIFAQELKTVQSVSVKRLQNIVKTL
ncbi:ATP-dependent RNA helicase HrpA [Candidatus Reidiella endopervernicosa]|nr:ATP-dependent RNA helicase HrpA [Candidatus Reidiella endopervernicosa]